MGDCGFCPCGSTIMILTESSLLKWPVENPESGDVCDCDDDFCEHAIDIKKDYDKLEEGLIVNAMWPFEGNHFYAGLGYDEFSNYKCIDYTRVRNHDRNRARFWCIF